MMSDKTNTRVVHKVSQIYTQLSTVFLRDDFFGHDLYIRGVTTNCKDSYSYHVYFAIKDPDDKDCIISCKIDHDNLDILDFNLVNGLEVIVKARITTEKKYGTCQLYVTNIMNKGEAGAKTELMKLRAKLEAMGWMSDEIKKPLPAFPRVVGIVSNKGGDGLKDFIRNAKKRAPYVSLVVCYATLEGKWAPDSVAAAIRTIDEHGVDVVVVARGGGSDSGLETFDTETVAKAVYECKTPIVCATGHERHKTLADEIADHRSSTPNGAASEVIPDVEKLFRELDQRSGQMDSLINGKIDNARSLLKQMGSTMDAVSPMVRLETIKERLKGLRLNLDKNSPRQRLEDQRQRMEKLTILLDSGLELRKKQLSAELMKIGELDSSIKNAWDVKYKDKLSRYRVLVERLNGLSPTAKLVGGFGFISDLSDKPIGSVSDMNVGDRVKLTVHDGTVVSRIEEGMIDNGEKR